MVPTAPRELPRQCVAPACSNSRPYAPRLLDLFPQDLRPWNTSKLAVGKTPEAWSRKGTLLSSLTPSRSLSPSGILRLARFGAKG